MADYRQIHTCIWKDSWFIELESDQKLLFIYLFSNERANLTGLYDLSLRVVAFETGLDMPTIESGLAMFAEANKVFYEDGMVWVPTLLRHNAKNITSPKIQAHLKAVIKSTRDCPLKDRWIAYYNQAVPDGYRIDTLSIPNPESDHEHVLAPVPVPVLVPDQETEQDQYDNFNPPPAVKVWGDLTNQTVPNWTIALQIHEAVGKDPDDLEMWRNVINAWLVRGYKKWNIEGPLEWFREGIPENGKGPPSTPPPKGPIVLDVDLDAEPAWIRQ